MLLVSWLRSEIAVGIEQNQDLVDATIVGAAYLADGVVAYSEWSERMLTDLGDEFRPMLSIIFEFSKQYYAALAEAIDFDTTSAREAIQQKAVAVRAELDSKIKEIDDSIRRLKIESEKSKDLLRAAASPPPASEEQATWITRLIFALARCIAAGFALYATARHPYSLYVLTRWIVFLTCCWGLFLSRHRLWPSLAPAYAVVGLVFNPLFLLHFARSTWHGLDIAAGVILLASLVFDHPRHRSR